MRPLPHAATNPSISARTTVGTSGRPHDSQHSLRASVVQCSLFLKCALRFVDLIFVKSWAQQCCSTRPRQWCKANLLETQRFGRGNSLAIRTNSSLTLCPGTGAHCKTARALIGIPFSSCDEPTIQDPNYLRWCKLALRVVRAQEVVNETGRQHILDCVNIGAATLRVQQA